MAKINLILSWIKSHRFESICLLLIIFISLFFRLFRISEYLTFLGDEGRDVRIVRNLLNGDLVFIGPQTSIGNMYLGPLYYYLIAPSLWLSGLNPVGPAIMNALIGTLTVFFTWFVARRWFNPTAGIVASLLFAISPVAIIYSRSSWNPNPMPLFALLCIWGIYQVWQFRHFRWLPIIGISFAFALQMHYLGLLLIPVIIVFWFLTLRQSKDNLVFRKIFIRQSLFGLLIFLVLMSPLLLFDLKHDFMNFKAFKEFFANRQTTVNINPANSDRFLPVIYQIIEDLVLSRQKILLPLVSLVIVITSFLAYRKQNPIQKPAAKILFSWLILAILGLGIYKQHVYAHYFGFIFPAVYLLLGLNLSTQLLSKKILFRLSGIFMLGFLLCLSLNYSPIKATPNRQLQRTEAVVDLIIHESHNEPFNFGLIAKQNYDESYRYFLENKKAPLVRGEEGITKQLFVICEDGDACQPVGHSDWQIAIFGLAKLDQTWQVDNIKIYRLVHP
jgi:4-amino-4-deoxy-L-arabinose transferase-like glycosyltransferase